MKNDIESFIVRIWSEGNDGQSQFIAWRGSVDHVGTNHRFYFYELEGLSRFIEAESGIVSHPSKSWLHSLSKWVKNVKHLFGVKNHARDTN